MKTCGAKSYPGLNTLKLPNEPGEYEKHRAIVNLKTERTGDNKHRTELGTT